MGWFSNVWKKVKNVFKKVTKVVKKVVKAVGKTAKKVWNGVKSTAQKFAKGMSKLGPFANIAMNFIPGFGQLWQAYGIWGQLAKGAITGFALSGGEVKGALLGAITAGAGDVFKQMKGGTIAEKVGNWWDGWTNNSAIGKAVGKAVTDFKDAFKPAGTKPVGQDIFDKHMATEYAPNYTAPVPLSGTSPEDMQKAMEKEAYGGPREKGWTFAEGNPSWADKLRQGTQAHSLLTQQPQSSFQLPYGAYDTSKMTAYDTTAGPTSGQIAGGTDVHNIKEMTGLLSAIERMRESESIFLNPNYS